MSITSIESLEKKILELEVENKRLKSRKKYGLIWENKPEDVVLQCEQQIPVLKEIKNRKIVTDNTSPTNLLIEGDNYHALSVLNYTHKGKIDVIYIDPPYNTGNKDFIYNDDYVDKEDSFRHSKWLSFMEKRLRLAKDLLKDSGVIFISIDDNEQAQLKLLCDSVFGENNFVSNMIWHSNKSVLKQSKTIRKDHEYVLVYSLKYHNVSISKLENKMEFFNPDNDKNGEWFSSNATYSSNDKKHKNYFGIKLPNKETCYRVWKFSEKEFKNGEVSLYFNNGNVPRLKIYKNDYDLNTSIPSSLILNNSTTTTAKSLLSDIFNILPKELDEIFSYPKPIELIKFLTFIGSKSNSIILDFMAGSGTTGHAVMELNKEDGGNRQYILCTNNENNICEEVTYERLKRVIKGYTNKKGENIEGLGGNLEYLKCEYIDKTRHSDNMKMRLMRACSEMLCLKENTFNLEKEVKDGDTLMYRIYSGVKVISQGSDSTTVKHYMGVYYDLDDSYLEDMRSELKHYEDAHKTAYIFSLRSVSDFIDDYRKWKGIHIEEVPEKILEMYETIYKRNNRR
jgi:adenine-specific DNA-methyltransferase